MTEWKEVLTKKYTGFLPPEREERLEGCVTLRFMGAISYYTLVKISSTLSIYQKIIFFSTERIVTQVNETTNVTNRIKPLTGVLAMMTASVSFQ